MAWSRWLRARCGTVIKVVNLIRIIHRQRWWKILIRADMTECHAGASSRRNHYGLGQHYLQAPSQIRDWCDVIRCAMRMQHDRLDRDLLVLVVLSCHTWHAIATNCKTQNFWDWNTRQHDFTLRRGFNTVPEMFPIVCRNSRARHVLNNDYFNYF